MALFQPIVNTQHKIKSTPILLIDSSGSTSCYFDHGCTIFQKELEVIALHMSESGADSAYIMLWSSSGKLVSQEPVSINQITNIKNNNNGGTSLTPALNAIPSEWISGNDTDLFIVTDGQIGDNPSHKLQELFAKNIRVHIFTVEDTIVNYMDDNANAGSRIYQIVKQDKLTDQIRSFRCFNNHHPYGFDNFNNYDVPDGWVPFGNQMFVKEDLSKFMEHIQKIDKNALSENELKKLVYDVTQTLYYLTKNSIPQVENKLIRLFVELFKDSPVYQDIRNRVVMEIKAKKLGQASTFQEYRSNRTNFFAESQTKLYQNVKESITNKPNEKYISTIVTTEPDKESYIVAAPAYSVKQSIRLGQHEYKNATMGPSIPVLPLLIESDGGSKDQCLRQWIRTIYSRKYDLKAPSEKIIYLFLQDMVRIYLSDVEDTIKKAYIGMGKIMLDAERYGTNDSELRYIIQIQSTEYFSGFINKHLYNGPEIEPHRWWYAIFGILGIPETKDYRKDDEWDLSLETVLQELKPKLKLVRQLGVVPKTDFDYFCYVNSESTQDTGGYKIKSHPFYMDVECDPKFVISEDGYRMLKESGYQKCPVCYQKLVDAQYMKVGPQENSSESADNSEETKKILAQIPQYQHHSVKIPVSYYTQHWKDPELLPIDTLDFHVDSYSLESANLADSLNNISIQVKTQEKFDKIVKKRFPFLEELNMENACLAGGFCRSILLKNRMKDFDFFFYGTDNPLHRFRTLVSDLTKKIKEQHSNDKLKFLSLFKPQFNVYEVAVVRDKNDSIGDDFNLDYFDKYDFHSLHPFHKSEHVDPKTGNVTNKHGYLKDHVDKEKLKNYFEDGDSKGISLLYRLQFILVRYDSILDILNTFDLYPSRVAYDGNKVYFTESSHLAYKYMINVTNQYQYNDLYLHRLGKYFNYGFSVVLPRLQLPEQDKNFENSGLHLGNENYYKITMKRGSELLVTHDSNNTAKIGRSVALEKRGKERQVFLYNTYQFCSLVSLLRYVKINDINYIFSKDVQLPAETGAQVFRESKADVKFISELKTMYTKNFYQHIKFYNNNFQIQYKEIVKNQPPPQAPAQEGAILLPPQVPLDAIGPDLGAPEMICLPYQ